MYPGGARIGVDHPEFPDAVARIESRLEALVVGEARCRDLDHQLGLAAPQSGTLATVTNHVFLGNISEYEITLGSGAALRVQTHPTQQFKVGEPVAIEIDGSQCSAFPRARGETAAG